MHKQSLSNVRAGIKVINRLHQMSCTRDEVFGPDGGDRLKYYDEQGSLSVAGLDQRLALLVGSNAKTASFVRAHTVKRSPSIADLLFASGDTRLHGGVSPNRLT